MVSRNKPNQVGWAMPCSLGGASCPNELHDCVADDAEEADESCAADETDVASASSDVGAAIVTPAACSCDEADVAFHQFWCSCCCSIVVASAACSAVCWGLRRCTHRCCDSLCRIW